MSPHVRAAPGRVRKRSEYVVIQAHGRRVTTPHFVLALWASDDAARPATRFGITASRKIGGAVVRNRAKRVVRAAFRESNAAWAPDIDVVVIVRRSLGTMRVKDVLAEWRAVASLVERRCAEARGDRAKRAAVTSSFD